MKVLLFLCCVMLAQAKVIQFWEWEEEPTTTETPVTMTTTEIPYTTDPTWSERVCPYIKTPRHGRREPVTSYKCCKGWTGDVETGCKIPVCKKECQNGGICVAPNQCQCQPGLEGPRCEKVKKGLCWTDYINNDVPYSGKGDFETIFSLRKELGICKHSVPEAIECQTSAGVPLSQTTQNVTCDRRVGLICDNRYQKDRTVTCQDYRVRFLCPCKTKGRGKICTYQGKEFMPRETVQQTKKGICQTCECLSDGKWACDETECEYPTTTEVPTTTPITPITTTPYDNICVYGSDFYEIGETKTIDCEICTCKSQGGWSCERKPECESKPKVCTVRGKIFQQGQTIRKGCNTCICVDGTFSCTKMICPPTFKPTHKDVCYDHHGNEFHEGETYQKDSCNVCVCTYGKWDCTRKTCTPQPRHPHTCTMGRKTYRSTETVKQGCNTCICINGEWSCTRKYCDPELPYPTHTTCYNRTTRTSYRIGDIFTQDCNICTCNAGIIQCSTTPCSPTGPCTHELMKYQTSRQLKGTFPPKCLPNGYYQPEQCHTDLGICYCVTPTGQRIKESVTFGHPDCSPYTYETTTEFTPVTETTTPFTQTTTEFTEPTTFTTEGVTTVPPCLKLLQTRKFFPGGFVPTCQADGSYHPTQCHANGYCFCVDHEGYMVKGTERYISEGLPDCTHFTETTTPVTPFTTEYTTPETPYSLCHKLRSRTTQTKPVCEKDGSFQPLQCDKTTRYCYCVTPTEGQIIPETLVRSWQKMPVCEDYFDVTPTPTPEYYETYEVPPCLKLLQVVKSQHRPYTPTCLADGTFAPLQCDPTTQYCHCVDPHGFQIRGTVRHFRQGTPDCTYYTTTPYTTTEFTPETTTEYTPETTTEFTATTTEYTQTTPYPRCFEMREMSRGQFVPKCTEEGHFEPLQCQDTVCYCVHPVKGVLYRETMFHMWEQRSFPDCDTYWMTTTTPTPCVGEECTTTYPCVGEECTTPYPCVGEECTTPTPCEGEECTTPFPTPTPCICEECPDPSLCQGEECTTPTPPCVCEYCSETPCVVQQRQYIPSPGHFLPMCEPDGSYAPLQCHDSYGYCFCSTPKGYEIPGTRVFGIEIPDCSFVYQTTTEYPQTTTEYTPETTTEYTPFTSTEFTPETTTEFTPETTTEYLPTTTYPFLNCFDQLELYETLPQVFRSVRPRCRPDGTFHPIQCNVDLKICYCVTPQGDEIHGTVTKGTTPDCTPYHTHHFVPEDSCIVEGFVYKEGQTFYKECNKCICEKGVTKCTILPCGTSEVCYHPTTGVKYQPGEICTHQCQECMCQDSKWECVPQEYCEMTTTAEPTTTPFYPVCEIYGVTFQYQRKYFDECNYCTCGFGCTEMGCNPDVCYSPMTGEEIKEGETVTTGCKECTCVNGHTECFQYENCVEPTPMCEVDGFFYKPGQHFYDQCNGCNCGHDGDAACTLIGCFPGFCWHPDTREQYKEGETMTKDCKECTCQEGHWKCTPQEFCEITTVPTTTVEPTTYPTCEFHGLTFQVGETYYDECNACSCLEYGTACTEMGCLYDGCYSPLTGETMKEGETVSKGCKECTCVNGRTECFQRESCEETTPMCEVDGFFYKPGQHFYDQCNTCNCGHDGFAACTLMACFPGSCWHPDTKEEFKEGETMTKDCKECTCQEGHWKCSHQEFCEITTPEPTTFEPTTTPYVLTTCVVKGKTYYEGETFYDGCNKCVCREGFPACPVTPCTKETTHERYSECKIKDFTFKSGEKFFYGCRECICNNGDYTCEDRHKRCPTDVCFHPTTGEKVREHQKISVQCQTCMCTKGLFKCKEQKFCKTPVTTPVTQCFVNGTYYETGQKFWIRCNQCVCKDGVTLCTTKKTCPTDKCYHPFTGVVYRPKQHARVDCNKCTCRPDGDWQCTKKMCPPTPVIKRTHVPKPTEHKTCTVDNCVFYNRQRFFQGCNKCNCINGNVACTRKRCSTKFCYSPTTGKKFTHGQTDQECTCVRGEWQCPENDVCPWQTPYTTPSPVTTPKTETCPNGEPLVDCFVDPCRYTTCPAFPGAVCVPNYCGSCQAVFYNSKGKPVVCEP